MKILIFKNKILQKIKFQKIKKISKKIKKLKKF